MFLLLGTQINKIKISKEILQCVCRAWEIQAAQGGQAFQGCFTIGYRGVDNQLVLIIRPGAFR